MLLMSLTGCYKNTVYLGPPPGLDTYEERAAFVFWGALPEHEIDMNQVCPQGVSRIEEQQNFTDGLIACSEAGATAAIQPGGSVRDEEVIAAADERKMAMIFTGHRHFLH